MGPRRDVLAVALHGRSASRSELLESAGWQAPPDEEQLPTGNELVDQYVAPLGRASRDSRRTSASTRGSSRSAARTSTRCAPRAAISSRSRSSSHPARDRSARGDRRQRHVVAAEPGRFERPGRPGEREHGDRVAYGIPDVLGAARERYAGKRVVVVGSGHSAFNVVLDLLKLAEEAPGHGHRLGRCGARTSTRCGAAAPPMRSRRAASWARARSGQWRPGGFAC